MPLSLDDLKQPPFHHEMILVEGGAFMMGNIEENAENDESPLLEVRLNDFFMGQYPVTQAFWETIMGGNLSCTLGENHPVECVFWEEILVFLEKLNALTGKKYRLPSEAEWEYAARGGTKTNGFKYAGSDELGEVAWFMDNSEGKTWPVGLKLPNELGLYDMCGNVQEWCRNLYYSYDAPPDQGTIWEEIYVGAPRMYRGGGWDGDLHTCRPTYRAGLPPDEREDSLGFRLVLPF